MEECGNKLGEPVEDAPSRVYNMYNRDERINFMLQYAEALIAVGFWVVTAPAQSKLGVVQT
jgi:hypothetical protein